jgi:hypothetical protein
LDSQCYQVGFWAFYRAGCGCIGAGVVGGMLVVSAVTRMRALSSFPGRRRTLAVCLAARFTFSEQAVLAVVTVEVSKRGRCGLTVAHLAALAGVSKSTVRNGLRRKSGAGAR